MTSRGGKLTLLYQDPTLGVTPWRGLGKLGTGFGASPSCRAPKARLDLSWIQGVVSLIDA
jgi:hypothetical protein